jgi:hypothetical protein
MPTPAVIDGHGLVGVVAVAVADVTMMLPDPQVGDLVEAPVPPADAGSRGGGAPGLLSSGRPRLPLSGAKTIQAGALTAS